MDVIDMIDTIMSLFEVMTIIFLCVALALVGVYAVVEYFERRPTVVRRFLSYKDPCFKHSLVFMYAERTKIFRRIKYESIHVDISHLSDKTGKNYVRKFWNH